MKIVLKNWSVRKKFTNISMVNFWQFYGKRALHKILWSLDQFSRSYEIKKFWIQRKWGYTRECTKNITSGGFLFMFLLILLREKLLESFMVFFTIFQKLMKLQSFEWLNCVSTYVTSLTLINMYRCYNCALTSKLSNFLVTATLSSCEGFFIPSLATWCWVHLRYISLKP